MKSRVETFTLPNTPNPISPYSHIANTSGSGRRPASIRRRGNVAAQTRQIVKSFVVMLEAVVSDLSHVTHINIFLQHMSDFEAMNEAYVEMMGDHRPARAAIAVEGLPKPVHC